MDRADIYYVIGNNHPLDRLFGKNLLDLLPSDFLAFHATILLFDDLWDAGNPLPFPDLGFTEPLAELGPRRVVPLFRESPPGVEDQAQHGARQRRQLAVEPAPGRFDRRQVRR